MRRRRLATLLCLAGAALAGCDSRPQPPAPEITESIKSVIVQAMKDKPAGSREVVLRHDGTATGLRFLLPPSDPIDPEMADFERSIPKQATAGHSMGKDVIQLGSADWPMVSPSPRDVRRYYFNFKLRPTTNPAVKNTYELLIQVFHADDWGRIDDPPAKTVYAVVSTTTTK